MFFVEKLLASFVKELVEPMYAQMARDLETILCKMHKEDYQKWALEILFPVDIYLHNSNI